jgi:AcrR family transcriptional regulator
MMPETSPSTSPRRDELLDRAYRYVLDNGLSGMSLRPLASAIGTSPRVLLFLFGSKDELVRALLARARTDEVALLQRVRTERRIGLVDAATEVWRWLCADEHRGLLILWTESYARALTEPDGAWSGFAQGTVDDWLELLADAQPPHERDSAEGEARRTLALAVLRGALLDLLATGDVERTTRAVACGFQAFSEAGDRPGA